MDEHFAAGKLSSSDRNAVFGRLSSRCILFSIKKGKDGIEGKVYKSFSEVQSAFESEVVQALGGEELSAVVPKPKAAPQLEKAVDAADFESVSDPRWLANQAGFSIGNLYTKKESPGLVFKLIAMAEGSVSFESVDIVAEKVQRHTAKFSELQGGYTQFKGKLQTVITADRSSFIYSAHEGIAKDLHRTSLFQAITALAETHSDNELLLDFLLFPSEIWANANVKVGKLILVPVTELSKITSKTTANITATTEDGKTKLALDAPVRVSAPDRKAWAHFAMFAAFWWVSWTDKKAEANMQLTTIKHRGWFVPVMKNTKDSQKYHKLVCFKSPEPSAKKART